jgi:hypothetical protein
VFVFAVLAFSCSFFFPLVVLLLYAVFGNCCVIVWVVFVFTLSCIVFYFYLVLVFT